jgi:transcriptional regulator with XRE-family HTH domain
MEKLKIHIGDYIKETVKQRGFSLAEVARSVGISRQKLNGWLKKDDIHVKDLFTLSKAINYDLFKPFCIVNEPPEQESKVILHIEVGKDKMSKVLKYIQDRELYNILKTE